MRFGLVHVYARETAAFIARETNCELEIDERITERANWGDLKGQTFQSLN